MCYTMKHIRRYVNTKFNQPLFERSHCANGTIQVDRHPRLTVYFTHTHASVVVVLFVDERARWRRHLSIVPSASRWSAAT